MLGGEIAKVEDEVWENMIKEFDLNGDGELDYGEFLTMMYSLKSPE
jgi:Ca2+-binding EF-hand superfamily protein